MKRRYRIYFMWCRRIGRELYHWSIRATNPRSHGIRENTRRMWVKIMAIEAQFEEDRRKRDHEFESARRDRQLGYDERNRAFDIAHQRWIRKVNELLRNIGEGE